MVVTPKLFKSGKSKVRLEFYPHMKPTNLVGDMP